MDLQSPVVVMKPVLTRGLAACPHLHEQCHHKALLLNCLEQALLPIEAWQIEGGTGWG